MPNFVYMLQCIADQARESIIYIMNVWSKYYWWRWLHNHWNAWKICGQSVQSNHRHEQYLLFPTALRCVDPPAAPVHGQRNATGLAIGSTVIYSCEAGYTLNGSSTITCMASTQWSGKAPDCSRKLLFHQMYMCIRNLGMYMQAINILLFLSEIFL